MITRTAAADVLAAALSQGGDFAELYFETSHTNGISMINGRVEQAVSGVGHGCGLRVLDGQSAIYAYSNDTSTESLLRLAAQTADALGRRSEAGVSGFAAVTTENIHRIEIMPGTVEKSEIAGLLREASDSAFAYGALVTQTSNSYSDTVKDVLIINSDGLWTEDRRVRTRVSVSATATDAGEKQSGGFSPGALAGFELFNGLDMARLGRDSAEIAVRMLRAGYCPGGEMPVVIGNGFGGVIFHEACGHGLEATSVAKGASVFGGKLGERIASPLVTVVDDGTIPGAWGSINVDDEGTPARRNVLIEKGILKSYMVDMLNGRTMGQSTTGSARRECYRYAPTSRMTNTYIAPGESTPEDIIRATPFGLYAKKMGGGSVVPATGEFNFSVTEGYMIRGGEIAEPVRGATLIGKGAEVLMEIDMVGNDMRMEQGMCGSLSGSVPTNVGQPTIRAGRLTVGGRRAAR